ncbi:MAG: RDD family protein [Perlucidibaca sp.]
MARSDNSFRSRRHKPAPRPAPAPAATPAEQLPTAGVGLRLITLIYDTLLLIALTAVINTILIAIVTPGSAAHSNTLTVLSPGIRHGLMFPATVLVIFVFYGYCWTRSGQTLGMQTWRLETRRVDGRRMRWGDSLLRLVPAFCGLASWLLHGEPRAFGLSVLLGLLFNYAWYWLPLNPSLRKRCLHDLLSHTEVVRQPAKPRQRKAYRFLGLFGDRED